MFSKTFKYLKNRTQNGNFMWRTLGFWSSGFYNMMGLRLLFNLKKLAAIDESNQEADQENFSNIENKAQAQKFYQQFKKAEVQAQKLFLLFASIAIFITTIWLVLTVLGNHYFGQFNYYLLIYNLAFALLAYQQFRQQKALNARLQDFKKTAGASIKAKQTK